MAFSVTNSRGQQYYLHRKDIRPKNQTVTRPMYYFAKDVREGAVGALPEGYEVIEAERTGLPMLRKVRVPA